jgi:hypothetical protein
VGVAEVEGVRTSKGTDVEYDFVIMGFSKR